MVAITLDLIERGHTVTSCWRVFLSRALRKEKTEAKQMLNVVSEIKINLGDK